MATLTPTWNERFIDSWNRSPQARDSMRGAGPVRFVELDHNIREAIFFWDEAGQVTLENDRQGESMPCFTARSVIWDEFCGGGLEARWAVMTRKIKYTGSMSFAVRYGESFNWVARVLRDNQQGG
ncbi:hypothetical protein LPN04_28195 [Rugamonas sp. A1-17]|nr:hypothetical protein [Rugamonas sp. A1-17]